MSQKELVMQWIYKYGSITPAKMAGHIFMKHMFGSETSRRCRELREEGQLYSNRDKKFEVFYLSDLN